MPKLFWDIETRSTVSLEDAGAWRYAADAMTEILCIAFAIEDHEPQIWTPSQPIPTEFFELAGNPTWCVVAHNQQFERAIATHILQPRFGWPEIPLAQQRCSMTLALAHALPGALENAAAALKLPFQKDREGYRLMRLMSRPRRPRKNEDPAASIGSTTQNCERVCSYTASVTSKPNARRLTGCRRCRPKSNNFGSSTR